MTTTARMRIDEFDGLRGLLAWWVVATHLSYRSGYSAQELHELPGLARLAAVTTYGSLAVEIFIILSGFVIFLLLERSRESYGVFVLRRFFRLAPVFYLTFAAAVAARTLFDDVPYSPGEVVGHLAAHATMLHGVVPNEVLPSASTSFLGPAWSISVEWQFYLLAPLGFLLLQRSPLRAIVLVLLCLAGFVAAEAAPLSWDFSTFVFQRAPLFLTGICSYYVFDAVIEHRERLRRYAPYVLPVTLSVVAIEVSRHGAFGVLSASTIWLVLMAIVVSDRLDPDLPHVRPFAALLRSRILRWLGAVSYSTYLAHDVILYVVQQLLQSAMDGVPRVQFLLVLTSVSVPIIVIVSWMVFRVVEKPGIRLGRRLASSAAGRTPRSEQSLGAERRSAP